MVSYLLTSTWLVPTVLVSSVLASPLNIQLQSRAVDTGVFLYQGCYTEATGMRALSDASYFDDQMTVEKCATACTAYTYMGVEYGRECYCGNTINPGSVQAPESDCNFQCPGDSSETCGAGNRLNLYEQPTIPTTAPIVLPVATYTALGCYSEATNGRALNALRDVDYSMTVELCASYCSAYHFFGVEYHDECYCGNELQAGSAMVDSSQCKYPCDGNSAELCGGDYVLNLYINDAYVPAVPSAILAAYTYQGCYTEATNMRALSDSVFYDDNMTREKCATACVNYNYFGVEYGRECYCGNTLNAGSVMTAESDCYFQCPGDNAETCGAGNRLNLFELTTAYLASQVSGTTTTTSSSSSVAVTSTSSSSSSSVDATSTSSSVSSSVSSSTSSTSLSTSSTASTSTSTSSSTVVTSTLSSTSSASLAPSTTSSSSTSSTPAVTSSSSSSSSVPATSTSSITTSSSSSTLPKSTSLTSTSSSPSAPTTSTSTSHSSTTTSVATTSTTSSAPNAVCTPSIVNGGFESGAFSPWTTSQSSYGTYSIVGTSSGEVDAGSYSALLSFFAASFVVTTLEITNTISTCTGSSYTISYAFSLNGGTTGCTHALTVNGVTAVGTATTKGVYKTFTSAPQLASAGSATIAISFSCPANLQNSGGSFPKDLYLDAVTVQASA